MDVAQRAQQLLAREQQQQPHAPSAPLSPQSCQGGPPQLLLHRQCVETLQTLLSLCQQLDR
jgi:hypothetical protein